MKSDYTIHFSLFTIICLWGCSSVGRASALQAGGQEFDSPHLHQSIYLMDAILNENAKHFHFLSPLTEKNRGKGRVVHIECITRSVSI